MDISAARSRRFLTIFLFYYGGIYLLLTGGGFCDVVSTLKFEYLRGDTPLALLATILLPGSISIPKFR